MDICMIINYFKKCDIYVKTHKSQKYFKTTSKN